MAESWRYEKLDENMELVSCPQDDKDGSVTGHLIINVPRWFDENPQERIRLGWTKHITHDLEDVEYNRQTQFVITTTKQVDEYTIEDEFHILDKSEEQLLFEDMLEVAMSSGNSIVFF